MKRIDLANCEHFTCRLRVKSVRVVIGGNEDEDAGTFILNGGSVTALGGKHAAGVGGGEYGYGGTVIVNGGSLSATGRYYGAGIGGGAKDGCGTVYVFSGAGSPAEAYCLSHENCVFVPVD